MRVHVTGIGSIGTLVAFHLRRSNPPPAHAFTLLSRRSNDRRQSAYPQNEQDYLFVESDGIRRRIGGFDREIMDSKREPPRRFVGRDQKTSSQPDMHTASRTLPTIQSLLVTTKATSAMSAIETLLPRLNASSTIILLQNGIGVYDHLVEKLFPDVDSRPNFIIGSVTHGVWAKRPRDVVHASPGNIQFALVPDELKRRNFEQGLVSSPAPDYATYSVDADERINSISIARRREEDPKFYSLAESTRLLLRAHGDLQTSWVPMDDMQVITRRKLVVNACIGPLTAIGDCPNGALVANPAAYRIIRSVCAEAATIYAAQAEEAAAAGRSVSPLWATSLSRKALEETVHQIIRSTSRNYSSMLMDARRGNLTEVEYINGYLTRAGAALGIPAPTNTSLLDLMRMKRLVPASPASVT
ncbi:2-dehydropantoate 2-reductase [Clavulina sp. PMI_390]|nr:2-dehydropantoate 2-reductase [Clavulina sp. PMI_390]